MMNIISIISVCSLGGGTCLLMMKLEVHTMPQMFALFLAIPGTIIVSASMVGSWLGRKMRSKPTPFPTDRSTP